mgnify:FL=1
MAWERDGGGRFVNPRTCRSQECIFVDVRIYPSRGNTCEQLVPFCFVFFRFRFNFLSLAHYTTYLSQSSFPLTVSQALPLSKQFHQQIQAVLPLLPGALSAPTEQTCVLQDYFFSRCKTHSFFTFLHPPPFSLVYFFFWSSEQLQSESFVATEVVTNTLSVILGDPLLDEEGELDNESDVNETEGRYRAHYAVLGDVAVAAIASIQTNPFEASLCLRRTKRCRLLCT